MREKTAGFSVIEALVAVAILAIALAPLLTLQTQVSRQYQKERAIRQNLTDQRNVLAVLRDANVMAGESGSIALSGGRTASWRAHQLSRATPTLAREGTGGGFEVALYRIDVEVQSSTRAPISHFSYEQLGWRAAQTPS